MTDNTSESKQKQEQELDKNSPFPNTDITGADGKPLETSDMFSITCC